MTYRCIPLNCKFYLLSILKLKINIKTKFFRRVLKDNELDRIDSDGLFGRLPHLLKLDLRNNHIAKIEPNAFDGASQIQDLQLAENKIKEISNKMFLGLHQLKSL